MADKIGKPIGLEAELETLGGACSRLKRAVIKLNSVIEESNPLTEWQAGVFYAAAVLIDLADQPGYAIDVLSEAGLSGADCSSLGDYEKSKLRSVDAVKCRLHLQGLD